jgi:hypothetical protein
MYSPDGKSAIVFSVQNKVIVSAADPGTTILPMYNSAFPALNNAAPYKPFVSDGQKLCVIIATAADNQATAPYPWIELPLRSYNTATTFWVPPVKTDSVSLIAYVYAGD